MNGGLNGDPLKGLVRRVPGDKLRPYKQLPSLEAVLLISHRLRQVTLVTRTGAAWDERKLRPGETVPLGDAASFAATDLYSVVDLG